MMAFDEFVRNSLGGGNAGATRSNSDQTEDKPQIGEKILGMLQAVQPEQVQVGLFLIRILKRILNNRNAGCNN